MSLENKSSFYRKDASPVPRLASPGGVSGGKSILGGNPSPQSTTSSGPRTRGSLLAPKSINARPSGPVMGITDNRRVRSAQNAGTNPTLSPYFESDTSDASYFVDGYFDLE
jgi:hypothetical protein